MFSNPAPFTRRRLAFLAVLLFATVFVRGLQVAAALMPFEGWDEYQHVAVADFLAHEGRMPTRADTVRPELWPFLRAHPHPESGAQQLGGLGAVRYDGMTWSQSTWVIPEGDAPDRPPLLYQAQHGPLYYRSLHLILGAPTPDDSSTWVGFASTWVRGPSTWVEAARLLNVAFMAASVAGWFVLLSWVYRSGIGVLLPGIVCVAVAANPLFLWNGARVSNDAAAILLATMTLLLYVMAVRRPDFPHGIRPFAWALPLGLLTAWTVLTKAIGLALLPVIAVGLVAVVRHRGRRWRAALAVAGTFLLAYTIGAGGWHLDNLARYGTLTPMQEAVQNREGDRSIVEIAGEIPGIVAHTASRLFVLDQFHVGGWSFADGTGGWRRVHRWWIRAGLLLGLVALIRSDSRRRLGELLRPRPEVILLLPTLWAALMHHALQTRLAHGWVATNPWYAALVLPVLVLLVLAGGWSLRWRAVGPLMGLGLAATWAMGHYRAMFGPILGGNGTGAMLQVQAGDVSTAAALERIADHHVFLLASGPGMLALGALLGVATVVALGFGGRAPTTGASGTAGQA